MKAYAHKKDGSYLEFNLLGQGKSGGEGTVYKVGPVQGLTGNFCAKIYHKEFLSKHSEHYAKLAYMVQHRPSVLSDSSEMIQICYPALLLFDASRNGKFIGFMMYLALDNSTSLEKITKVVSRQYIEKKKQMGKLSSLEMEIYNKFPRCQRPSEINILTNRYIIVHNIASLISYFHQSGHYVIGDIKPENILMTVKGGISLVDVDSSQIVENGKLLYRNEVSTPDYCPPEFLSYPRITKSVTYDLFSIAVLFYEILIGVHPYCCSVPGKQYDIPMLIKYGYFAKGSNKNRVKCTPHHSLFDYLPKSLQELFIRAFEGKPEQRPTALEWKHAMRSIITSDLQQATPLVKSTASYPKTTSANPSQSQSPKTKGAYCLHCGKKYYSVLSRFCDKCGKPRQQ